MLRAGGSHEMDHARAGQGGRGFQVTSPERERIMEAVWELFLSDFVRLLVLHRAAEESICRRGVLAELGAHGYEIDRARVDQVILALEEEGCLAACSPGAVPRHGKHYEITGRGRRFLKDGRQKLHLLAADLLKSTSHGTRPNEG